MTKLLSTEFLNNLEVENLELQNFIETNHRSELQKYYEKVKKCKMCGKEYGLDNYEKESGTCPVCARRIIL